MMMFFRRPEVVVALMHCVSVDMAMGKGIAIEFKKRFGGVDELKRQKAGVGGLAVLLRDNRPIYYLVTKEKYWNKPTLQGGEKNNQFLFC